MPSTRKRIGYLPSINAHETITKIAIKEKLSQSKVVGILVEEALIARDKLDFFNSSDFNKKNLFSEKSNIYKSSLEYSDFDELISDKGVSYNTNSYKNHSHDNLFEPKVKYNEELFEQFKQFIMFQKMIRINNKNISN